MSTMPLGVCLPNRQRTRFRNRAGLLRGEVLRQHDGADVVARPTAGKCAVAGLHGDYNGISFKDTGVMLGNVQFSFNRSRTGADIDIDIGNIAAKNPLAQMVGAIVHAEEVVQNSVFGTKTNQDTVRKLLVNNPKVQTITPSPDPKWNRP